MCLLYTIESVSQSLTHSSQSASQLKHIHKRSYAIISQLKSHEYINRFFFVLFLLYIIFHIINFFSGFFLFSSGGIYKTLLVVLFLYFLWLLLPVSSSLKELMMHHFIHHHLLLILFFLFNVPHRGCRCCSSSSAKQLEYKTATVIQWNTLTSISRLALEIISYVDGSVFETIWLLAGNGKRKPSLFCFFF